jgi:hypothetical protein
MGVQIVQKDSVGAEGSQASKVSYGRTVTTSGRAAHQRSRRPGPDKRMHEHQYCTENRNLARPPPQRAPSFRSCRVLRPCPSWRCTAIRPRRAACIWHGDCLIGMDTSNIENIHASLQAGDPFAQRTTTPSRCSRVGSADPTSGQLWRKQKASPCYYQYWHSIYRCSAP